MMNHEECIAYITSNSNRLEFENIANCYGSLVLTYADSTYTLEVECLPAWSGSENVPDYVGDALVNFHKEKYQK